MSNMKEIDVMGLFKDLKEKGEAKFSDHEKKHPENTKLMKKYFVKETYDYYKDDLHHSIYRIPAGKDFDKAVDDILKYFKKNLTDPEYAINSAKKYLKDNNLTAATGAEIDITMNTFDAKPLTKEQIR